jgi:hypothetical protein
MNPLPPVMNTISGLGEFLSLKFIAVLVCREY